MKYDDLSDIQRGFVTPFDDLSYMKIINPNKVRDFVRQLNNVKPKVLAGRKLVAAIGTGGTISMKVENGVRVPDLDFQGVFQRVNSHLSEQFMVLSLDAFRVDSSQMTYTHVSDLAIAISYVWTHIKVPIIGFLILHGTDTLPYTSAAMSLIMSQGLQFSIVYTAAQKSIQEPLNDAGQNIRNALFTLEALHEKNMAEVVVVMGDYAMLATSAVKVNETMVNAFDAPLHKYVTTFNRLEYPIRLANWLKPKRNLPFSPTIWHGEFAHTLVVRSTLGLSPTSVLYQLTDPKVRAVLLFSYGAGTVYSPIIQAIMPEANKRQIAVYVTSPVNAQYKVAYVSGSEMLKNGVIPLNMTLPAALAKIEIALRMNFENMDAMGRFMTTNYVGEIPTDDSRFEPKLNR